MDRKRVKVTLTVSGEIFDEFEAVALRDGFEKVPALIRHLAIIGLNEVAGGNGAYINGTKEVLDYVRAKGFGSLKAFASYAMESVMQRTPLSESQKKRLADC